MLPSSWCARSSRLAGESFQTVLHNRACDTRVPRRCSSWPPWTWARCHYDCVRVSVTPRGRVLRHCACEPKPGAQLACPPQVLLMVSLNLGAVPAFAGVAAAAAIIPLQALMVRPVGALRRATALCTDERVKLCSEAISVRARTWRPSCLCLETLNPHRVMSDMQMSCSIRSSISWQLPVPLTATPRALTATVVCLGRLGKRGSAVSRSVPASNTPNPGSPRTSPPQSPPQDVLASPNPDNPWTR